MDNKEKIWTEEMVVAALEEAIRTIKKLPSAKLRDYFTSWPQVVYKEIEILRMDQKPKNGLRLLKQFHEWKKFVVGFCF